MTVVPTPSAKEAQAAPSSAEMVTRLSPFAKWLGVVVAVAIALLGFILGLVEGIPVQETFFYAVATLAVGLWVWSHVFSRRVTAQEHTKELAEPQSPRRLVRGFLWRARWSLLGLAILVIAFLIAAGTVEGFLNVFNIVALLILAGLLILTMVVSRFVVDNRSVFIGLSVLVGLFVVGALTIEGFVMWFNIKNMLLFASFLGMACIGQTLVALLGGLDLSIPFVIGSANVGLLYLLGLGVPSWLAVIFILVVGGLFGIMNGYLSYRLQGQALILTLGTGFMISGLTQILTSIGTAYAGNVFGVVPGWLSNIAALNGRIFGIDLPPAIVIWGLVSLFLIWAMRNTVYGRQLYALGGARKASERMLIRERRYWVGAYCVSGFSSALTGCLLLGWSGGGFIGVGEEYLFYSLAAVVIGGTSLLGGIGGYGFTVIGVLVLVVLRSFLFGINLDFEWQQFILGLLILPIVALYGRAPHIRTQI